MLLFIIQSFNHFSDERKVDDQKSEGEDDSSSQPGPSKGLQARGSLGKTPNYLMLSTTSTLSASSTGSQAARLVERSQQPENYQPPQVQDLGKTDLHQDY